MATSGHANTAKGDVMVGTVPVVDPPGTLSNTPFIQTIDHSGLTPSYTGGVTDLDAYAALNP
jgi:hypothetical protein